MGSRSHHSSKDKPNASLMLTGLVQLPAFPPAPPPPTPFVGREQEQAQAMRLLQQRGIVAFRGGDGSGKSALAAALIAESNTPSIKIDLSAGLNDRVDAFMWQVARPLAQVAPATWRALHQIQQAYWDYPAVVRLQMILDSYAQNAHEMVLWIDGLTKAIDSQLAGLIAGLCEYVAQTHRTQIRIILEGRSLPYRLEAFAIPPLQGLSPDAIVSWAEQVGVPLSAAHATEVYRQTGGSPRASMILLAAWRERFDPAAVERVISYREVRRFIAAVLDRLSAGERQLLAQIVAEVPTRNAFTSDLVFGLEALEDLQLVTIQADTVQAHPLIQHFYQYYTRQL
jgi:hypothetical protein